jgi:prevent-host-death family protein
LSQTVRRVGVHEAKTHLSRLLREVEAGKEVVVTRGGVPVARIVPAETVPGASSYGLFRGQFEIGDDFDADSDFLADLFDVPR